MISLQTQTKRRAKSMNLVTYIKNGITYDCFCLLAYIPYSLEHLNNTKSHGNNN